MPNPNGNWQTVTTTLDIVGVHAIVLHTGKVLYFCFDKNAVGQLGKNNDNFQTIFNNPDLGTYQIWDPVTQSPASSKPIGRNSFCAGQCQLIDGTILVAGGQDGAGAAEVTGEWDKWFSAVFTGQDNGALRDMQTYDPVADTWNRWPDLDDGRYYPTCLTLSDGSGFIAGGLSNLQQWVITGSQSCENDQFEIAVPTQLFAGPTPKQPFESADQYPILCLLPGTHLMFVHVETKTKLFNLDSNSFVQNAEFIPPAADADGNHVGRQTYPMQTGHCLLPQKEGDPPRILIVGGSTWDDFNFNAGILGQLDFVQFAPAVRGGFIFDLNMSDPTKSKWRLTRGAPTIARLLCDTVLLPDGKVFVVNGIIQGAAAGHSQATTLVAEIFDPMTEMFTKVAPNPDSTHPRGYHSTAILLPDATVAIAGNTDAYNPGEPNRHDDTTIQIYTPPYLFNGPRPVATGVPATVNYGSQVSIAVSGAPVTGATLMRPCAVTHTVDMDQRAIFLPVTVGAGSIQATFPMDHALAPPGFYMLFLIASDGTPSQASWVQLQDGTPSFPPIDLGTYSGDCVIEEAFDGDVTLEKIDQGCKVTLESRHGSILIKHKIDNGSYANLKAAKDITIGETIDQHSITVLTAGGNVSIAQNVDQFATAKITAGGSIDIGQKVNNTAGVDLTAGTTVHIGQMLDQHSHSTITAQGDVRIDQTINQHALANITSVTGAIHIGQKIDNYSIVQLSAGTTIDIGQTIDQHSQVTATAQGDITISEKLDQNSVSQTTSVNGSINLGQGMSGNATATLIARNGDINIANSVDSGSTLNWAAQHLNCPHQDGNITEIP